MTHAVNSSGGGYSIGSLRLSLRWRLNRLQCMSSAEILHRLSRLGVAHLERVVPRFPVPAPDRAPSRHRWVHVPHDIDPASYVEAAERISAGELAVFSARCSGAGMPPRWNRDPTTGTEAPLTAGKLLDYRDRRLVGDIKYLWEPNRHLHLVILAQAYALTGDRKYLCVLRWHLDNWIDACPYGRGPNWCSSLEAAIRLINWSISWQLMGGLDSPLFWSDDGLSFRRRWLGSVFQHAQFIRGYFSRHSSANNHLIGEAAGLYIASLTWPCWPGIRAGREVARRILEREALLQISDDGVDREQAVCYQQFVLDFLLLAWLAGASEGDRFTKAYEQRILAMLEFLASVMDVGGNVPMIGDSDDGAVTRLAQGTETCPYRSLIASGAILFANPRLKSKAGKLDDKTRWLIGAAAQPVFDKLAADATPRPPQRIFPRGGYYILGCDFESGDEVRLVADAGPLGYRSIAAHGHADALSFTLSMGGLEFLIDPGTYAYHGGGRWRAYFRGTAAHNTVRIDGVDQSEAGGDFMWVRHARAVCNRWETSTAVDRFEGWHDGYSRLGDPVIHRRRITLDKQTRRVVIEDRLEMAARHEVELCFHCSESCEVVPVSGGFAIKRGGWTLHLGLPQEHDAEATLYVGSVDPLYGWVSRRFGERCAAPTIVWRARKLGGCLLRTELTCRSDYAEHS